MTQVLETEVRLYKNPWVSIIGSDVLHGIVSEAADTMVAMLLALKAIDAVADERNSFGCVIMDPTEPEVGNEAVDMVLATIAIGPNGEKYIPNGFAKAHATVRHGYTPNGLLVARAPHCLDSGDFAWGHAAVLTVVDEDGCEYPVGCAGGSGLSAAQDQDLALACLTEIMGAVDKLILDWVEMKRVGASHGWYNNPNQPGHKYAKILEHPYPSVN